MKVCMLCPEIGNAGDHAFIGGAVNNVVRLSRALAQRGHQITIVTTPHRYAGSEATNKIDWAEIVCLPVHHSYASVAYGMSYAWKSVLRTRQLEKSRKFDIVHGHSGYSMPALITGACGRLSGVPAVHSIYCQIRPTRGSVVKALSNGALSHTYFGSVGTVIAINETVRSSLVTAGLKESKLRIVPLGIELGKYHPEATGAEIRKQYGITPQQPVILYIGNMSEIKGIHILIDALTTVAAQVPDIRLFMVINMPLDRYYSETPGALDVDMKLLPRIKQIIRERKLEQNVIPIGITDQLPQIISACDMNVVPFLNTVGVADIPLSMVEAMAAGKPALATNVGSIPNLVNSANGILLEPGHADTLSQAILQLCRDTDRQKKMGHNAAQAVRELFSVDSCAAKIETVYEEVGHRRES